jgi:hypothetical protein
VTERTPAELLAHARVLDERKPRTAGIFWHERGEEPGLLRALPQTCKSWERCDKAIATKFGLDGENLSREKVSHDAAHRIHGCGRREVHDRFLRVRRTTRDERRRERCVGFLVLRGIARARKPGATRLRIETLRGNARLGMVRSMDAPSRNDDKQERLVAVDALRGFALLGILVMNIQAFARA